MPDAAGSLDPGTGRDRNVSSAPRGPTWPIVTLTTDFGTRDHYVAAMKAVLVRHCPTVRLIDVTHHVPRHDILCGSITLERAVDGFPPGTVHLAVVDPGVGTDRRILVAAINRQFIVCPDNGLLTWAWRRQGGGRTYAFAVVWRPERHSNVFHGRDIMAPVGGMLAAGEPVESLARPIDDPVLLDIAPADPATGRGRVIHIDHFGNATTNISHESLRALPAATFRAAGRPVGALRRTYWDVEPGKPLALIGSSGLLEIAVRDGSAEDVLGLRVGNEVVVE